MARRADLCYHSEPKTMSNHPLSRIWRTLKGLYREVAHPPTHFDERVCPDVQDIIFAGHLEVYRFFSQFVPEKAVLDVGCGTGYGSHFMITQGAASVAGIDYAGDAVAYASTHFQAPGLAYRQMNAEQLDFPDASFDVVTTSENLEHLPHPERNIAEIRRVLRPGGLLLLGTPNKEISSPWGRSRNPFHLREFTYEELDALLRVNFRHVHIFDTTFTGGLRSRWAKAQRRRRGRIGIEPQGQATIQIEHLAVNLAHLSNSHSFTAIAW
ncbi:MAG: class I SAM-dependent methyltransferase [Lentisphaerae bacterium]|nr:class I SAM-dependent methyltransferase [Lentisphaerota bacterium]